MNTSVNSCAPLKKLNKKLKKVSTKNYGLQTKGIQNPIKKKNTFFEKYIKWVDSNKNVLHQEYKTQRNSLSILLKQSKKYY